MQIHQLPTLTNLPAAGDYLPIDSNEQSYAVDYTKLAQALVEQYGGSSLGGVSQSIKSALTYEAENLSLVSGALSGNTTAGIRVARQGRIGILQFNFNGTPTFNDTANHAIIQLPAAFENAASNYRICTAQNGTFYLISISGTTVNMNVLGHTFSSVVFFRDVIPYIIAA